MITLSGYHHTVSQDVDLNHSPAAFFILRNKKNKSAHTAFCEIALSSVNTLFFVHLINIYRRITKVIMNALK